MQATADAEEEFGRSWARSAAGENQILARMRRNNPSLFNDGVFAKDSQFRSPAWGKAKESTRRRREKIRLVTGTSGGGKPPKLPGRSDEPSDGYRHLAETLARVPQTKRIHEPMRKEANSFRAPAAVSIPAERIAPETDPWRYFDKESTAVAEALTRQVKLDVRSVAEAKGPGTDGIKNPDGVLVGFVETIEFKLQTTAVVSG